MGKILRRIRREFAMMPLMSKGYSRREAHDWYTMVRKDNGVYGKTVDRHTRKELHKAGFLCGTLEKYDIALSDYKETDMISPFDYRCLKPFNTSFSKWIEDILTTSRILHNHQDVQRDVFFSLIRKDEKTLILGTEGNKKEYSLEDIVALLKEKGDLEIRPAFWKSKRSRYHVSYSDNKMLVDGNEATEAHLQTILDSLHVNYLVADYVDLNHSFSDGLEARHTIKFWVANDDDKEPRILEALMNIYETSFTGINEQIEQRKTTSTMRIDRENGSFSFKDEMNYIDRWDEVVAKVKEIGRDLCLLSYYTMSISLANESGLFTIVHFDPDPILPAIPFGEELNGYLKGRLEKKKMVGATVTFKGRVRETSKILFNKYVAIFCRKGIRPYMQKLWQNAVIDDLLHTKGASLRQKIWCWRRGFLSYRLWQYQLNEGNYRGFLSDYDYHWLNRINNDYQKWINDKTTYRYLMEPFKENLPQYYFSVHKEYGKAVICKMPDCPQELSSDVDAIITLLEQKGKLAFKASAGTHGDGFYCLAYDADGYHVNGKLCEREGVCKVLTSQKSFYIVTEYLYMHEELRKIYPNSVNTVRVMVVNEHGYDPKIMQTYMRIGASKTGFTDNVGYGGICAMVDRETGELYNPQTLTKHVFYDCPVHPDTGVALSGKLPNWETLKKTVLDVARYFGELEYLGFDVAIMDEGICILEINIHQDLHKVAEYTDEINEFFKKVIARKKRIHGIS